MSWIIYGTGGHASVVMDAILSQGGLIAFFIDDDVSKQGKTFWNKYEIKSPQTLMDCKDSLIIVAIGDNFTRRQKSIWIEEHGQKCSSVIHPTSIISKFAEICEGTFVAAGAIVEANCRIGKCAIVNTGATVNHDCVVGEFCHVAPAATLCGKVVVGNHTLIGANATILPCTLIGENVIVGAGSVVTKNILAFATVCGVPAKQINVDRD